MTKVDSNAVNYIGGVYLNKFYMNLHKNLINNFIKNDILFSPVNVVDEKISGFGFHRGNKEKVEEVMKQQGYVLTKFNENFYGNCYYHYHNRDLDHLIHIQYYSNRTRINTPFGKDDKRSFFILTTKNEYKYYEDLIGKLFVGNE